jgi:hypothetical protein
VNRWPLLIIAAMLATTGLLAATSDRASAQFERGERAFVYGINAAIPDNFVGTFAPPSAGTIYLLAGQPSLVSPRYTEIAFWPITNEYQPDWTMLNEPAPGTLEILQNGAVIAEVASTQYTIHFAQSEEITTAELFLGDDATAAHEQFEARQDAFQEQANAYFDAEREWQDAMADINERRLAGETITDVPPAPQRPDPIGIHSNGLNQGMPIDLEPGSYAIRLRAEDGTIVPDSERALQVFAPRRVGVGYTVVPQTRWTTPDESPAPTDVIFGAADSNLYLEPRVARELPARSWALLQNPQRSAADAGDWVWVNGEMLIDATLQVIGDGQVIAEEPLTAYDVEQVPGRQLGYDVVPHDPEGSGAPSFEAYPIQLAGTGARYEVRLMGDDGQPLAGSVREVRVPANPPVSRLFVLSAAPLVVGALVITRRQGRVKMPRAAES